MFRRYHLEVKDAKLDAPLARIQVVRDQDRCIGCGICAKACIYGVHARESALVDLTRMAEPVHDKCVACHRCVNECPKDALALRTHPDFAALGDSYFSADTIETLHYEADTGRVPVSGCGYRGPFSGPGFDRMWTDMSEIVRPTRDGIHGRETICTGVALGRKPERLEFSKGGDLRSPLPPQVWIEVPMVFDPLPFPTPFETRLGLARAAARAAAAARTLAIVDEDIAYNVGGRPRAVRLAKAATAEPARYEGMAYIELPDGPTALGEVETLRTCAPQAVVGVVLGASARFAARGLELALGGAAVLRLAADAHGRWTDRMEPGGPSRTRHLLDALRELERALVEGGVRDAVSVIASGGLARAEHVPKALLCGADAVGLDAAYVIALGMIRFDGDAGRWTPETAGITDTERAHQRLVNLVNSWRDQLLEVMGAMGIREARRLQGEEGRAMFYEDLQKEFLSLFTAPALKEHDPDYG